MITYNGKYTEDLGKMETKACCHVTERSSLPYIDRVIFQVAFSLLLAFLGPLEGSAFEKVCRMSLQYPRRKDVTGKQMTP